ncbi:MAG: AAA family ATPase [Chloroflexota bacterium]|nr:AAA family ATPase [Chloroflexota bacterium]
MAVQSLPTCPRCDAAVPSDARFCMNCGNPLAAVSPADESLRSRLTAAAPAPLVDKMRAARLTGERKPVTALFADVVGSTGLAEQMDPEDWTQMINEAFDLMSQAVFRYEGTIAQLQGDAMLAFFGAPVAHEDDPERAVHAALDMLAATDEFARQLRAAHGIEFRIRVGINTGPVVVGNVGTDLRYEYTAIGDAMNVAARMQAAAAPGTLLTTDATRRLLAESFDVQDLGEITVRGKAEAVHAYRVIGRRAVPGRRRGLERIGLESPMVGRDEELERLVALFGVVAAGRGRLAVLLGEPGIGKSRLLAELRRRLEAQAPDGAAPRWIEGHCVSYGRSVPYHLVLDLVRSMLAIPFVASESEAAAMLDERLAELLGEEASDVRPYLAHLLALPLDAAASERVQLDPETLQGRYVAALVRVLRALTAKQPVVLVCEDIHWADPASVEVTLQLVPLVMRMPVLLLVAGRSETDVPGWRLIAQARATLGEALVETRLQPLSDSDSRALVGHLLEIESLPDSVRAAILARAEGNPFFVEEVIRMFIESGAIVRRDGRWVATQAVTDVQIPATLHGLLLARIDQLPDEAKRCLRVASVIGRQFPVRVLERVLSSTHR